MEILNAPKFDLQEVVGKIWAVKGRILLFQIVVIAACIAVILLWPRSYRSEARIFLQLGKETMSIDPTATTGQTIGIQQSSREDEIMTAMDVLRGRGLLTKVVERLTPKLYSTVHRAPKQANQIQSLTISKVLWELSWISFAKSIRCPISNVPLLWSKRM